MYLGSLNRSETPVRSTLDTVLYPGQRLVTPAVPLPPMRFALHCVMLRQVVHQHQVQKARDTSSVLHRHLDKAAHLTRPCTTIFEPVREVDRQQQETMPAFYIRLQDLQLEAHLDQSLQHKPEPCITLQQEVQLVALL